jgi:photosystem II stability/assembly factor-like uncharacterized protein
MRHIVTICCLPLLLACQQANVATSVLTTEPTTTVGKANTIPGQARAFMRSTDGGKTWEDLSDGLPVHMKLPNVGVKNNQIHLGLGSTLYVGTGAPLGLSWAKHETNLNVDISQIFYSRSGVLIGIYGEGLYRELLAGSGVWAPLTGTLPDNTIRTFIERSNGHMLAGTESGVFRSTDGGAHWDKVLNTPQINGVFEHEGVLIATYYTGIARSTDDGTTWEKVFSQPMTFPYQVRPYENGLMGLIEYQHEDFKQNTCAITTSTDGGKTWKIDNLGFDSKSYQVGSFVQSGQNLLMSHNKGISRSADGGKTWELVYPLEEEGNYRLIIDGGVVYAAYFFGC